MHACLTTVSTLNGSVTWLLCMTLHSKFSYMAWMMFTNFCWIPWCCRIFQSDVWCRLLTAVSKSMNTMYKELLHLCDCTRIRWRRRVWSLHDAPLLKPACSWRSSLSTAVVMHWRMMRQRTLLVIVCLLQASDITSLSQMTWRMC